MRLRCSVLLAFALSFVGCAGMSQQMQKSVGVGAVTSKESSFDGAHEVVMDPAFVAPAESGTAKFKMGFVWRSSSPEVVAALVRISSLTDYNSITAASVNVDGNIVKLEPAEALTSHQFERISQASCSQFGCSSGMTVKESDRMFVMDFELLDEMMTAESVKVRIDKGRDYLVGDIKKDSYGNVVVKSSLPAFLAEVAKHR